MILKLKQSAQRARVRCGHPWVFANEVEGLLPEAANGTGVKLVDHRGRSLGSGIYNGASQIVWRRYAHGAVAWDRAFFEDRIARALARREGEPFCRLVWSESDDLPGLVVDRFDAVLVVQALTLAVDRALDAIIAVLRERLDPREVVVRNDAPARRYEGLDENVRTVSGTSLPPGWFRICGIDYRLDLQQGQKTGFYLDQREEHLRVAGHAAGRRVLDAFCNQGAFALQAARAGASAVVALDSSADCIELARCNAERNGLAVDFRRENVFDFFTANRDERYDLIVLDPPSFARNKAALEGALRGYKELNLRALRMLNPGGILATYSCSQHVDRVTFIDMLAAAARDAGRDVQLLCQTSQPTDHPVRLNFSESEYLKGALLRV